MQPSTRARIAAVLLAGAAAGLFFYGRQAPAVVLAVAGAAVLVLVTERNVPRELPTASARGGLHALAQLAHDLNLHGRGIFVPPGGALTSTRVFIPARDAGAGELPPLDDTTTIHRGQPGVLGLALEPPGAGLERAWAARGNRPKGGGPEEAASHVRGALEALGVGADPRLELAGNRVRASYLPTAFEELCRATREDLHPWALQGGCPGCSLVAQLVARAYNAPVRIELADEDAEGRVSLEMEVLERART